MIAHVWLWDFRENKASFIYIYFTQKVDQIFRLGIRLAIGLHYVVSLV